MMESLAHKTHWQPLKSHADNDSTLTNTFGDHIGEHGLLLEHIKNSKYFLNKVSGRAERKKLAEIIVRRLVP